MGKKGRLSSRKGRRTQPKRWAIGLSATGLAIFIGFGLWQTLVSKRTITPPPYEEPVRFVREIDRMVWRADNAIYRSVREGGINGRGGLSIGVRPTNQHGLDLDFTEVTITAIDDRQRLKVERAVWQRLAQMGREVRLRSDTAAEGKSTLDVYLRDFHTHRLVFITETTERPVKSRPRVAIIIDDLGYDRKLCSGFFGLDLPLTLSVLPSAPFSEEIAKDARKRGFELLLHMPMEPRNANGASPGPVVLTTDMQDATIRKVFSKSLIQVPGAQGVNNHMGSLFTEDREKMRVFLGELKKRGLFFVDSRTSSQTIGKSLAHEMGVPTVERNVFLDHDLQPEALRIQMDRLLGLSRSRGFGVGIGHPHRQTLDLLKEYLPKLQKEYDIVPVSDLVG